MITMTKIIFLNKFSRMFVHETKMRPFNNNEIDFRQNSNDYNVNNVFFNDGDEEIFLDDNFYIFIRETKSYQKCMLFTTMYMELHVIVNS